MAIKPHIKQAAARFKTSFKREVKYLRQNKGDGFLVVLAFPLLSAFLIWLFSTGQPNQLPIAVVDQSHQSLSRQLTQYIDATPSIQVQQITQNPKEALDALRTRQVFAVLYIPEQFDTSILKGQTAPLALQINSQYTTYSSTIERAINETVITFSTGIALNRLAQKEGDSPNHLNILMPIQVIATPLFNQETNYEFFLTLTLIPAVLQILVMVATVSALGREFRDGSSLNWLTQPDKAYFQSAFWGKLTPYLGVFSLYAGAYILFFTKRAPQSLVGSTPLVFFALILMVLASMAVSILLVGATKNLRMSLSLAGFYSAPAFAYSGQAFPLVAMPQLAQYWANILPLTQWIKVYNQTWLATAPLQAVQTPLLALLALCCTAIPGYFLLKSAILNPKYWGGR